MNTPNFFPARQVTDKRGTFTKQEIKKLGFNFEIKDFFVTTSENSVIRGMHWQDKPCDTNRIVTLLSGQIFDVVVDMRPNSPDFGKCQSWNLDSSTPGFLFIPKGFAHGYQVLSSEGVVAYLTDGDYCPEHDKGVLWSSIPTQWPIRNPIVSARDINFPTLSSYRAGKQL
jgi:dTDP-4-dehydrorhamnose 3,5-epimerase